jgi:hypothetical protein
LPDPRPPRAGKPKLYFSAHVNKKTPVNVMLDDIGKLTGQDNYLICSASMTIFLKGIEPSKILVDGVSPAEDADATVVNAYDYLCHTASTVFIQGVLEDLLQKIVELEKSQLVLTWLRTE